VGRGSRLNIKNSTLDLSHGFIGCCWSGEGTGRHRCTRRRIWSTTLRFFSAHASKSQCSIGTNFPGSTFCAQTSGAPTIFADLSRFPARGMVPVFMLGVLGEGLLHHAPPFLPYVHHLFGFPTDGRNGLVDGGPLEMVTLSGPTMVLVGVPALDAHLWGGGGGG
jgi:hypothetical protein